MSSDKQTTSKLWTIGQVVSVVAGNAVPIIAVFVWGWDALAVVLIYWLEAGLIGVFTLLKLILALPGYQPEVGRRVRYYQAAGSASRNFVVPQMSRLSVLPGFIAGYGFAMLFVAVFVTVFFGDESELTAVVQEMTGEWKQWSVLLVALIVDHAVAAYVDFFRGPEWARSDPVFHIWRPFARFVLFYLLIFTGATVVHLFSPKYLIIPFVVFKLIGELFTIPFGRAEWRRDD